jgi:hypothetical protein
MARSWWRPKSSRSPGHIGSRPTTHRLVNLPSIKVRKKVPSVLTWPLRRLVLARLTSRSLYLLFTSAARVERLCQVLTDTTTRSRSGLM